MKICVTAKGPTLEAPIEKRFGRCANLIFVEPDTLKSETKPNPGAMVSGGAGIQAAQFVIAHKAISVLTKHVGPNAYNALNAAGVVVYTGISGTIRDAIEQYKAGQLRLMASSNAPAHSGMGCGKGQKCKQDRSKG